MVFRKDYTPCEKMLIIGMAALAIWLITSSKASACTAVYVGKDVSDDGTVIERIQRTNTNIFCGNIDNNIIQYDSDPIIPVRGRCGQCFESGTLPLLH